MEIRCIFKDINVSTVWYAFPAHHLWRWINTSSHLRNTVLYKHIKKDKQRQMKREQKCNITTKRTAINYFHRNHAPSMGTPGRWFGKHFPVIIGSYKRTLLQKMAPLIIISVHSIVCKLEEFDQMLKSNFPNTSMNKFWHGLKEFNVHRTLQ